MAGRDVNININGKDNFTAAANSVGRSATNLKGILGKLNSPIGGGGGITSLIGGIGLAGATTAAVTFGVKSAAAFEQTNVAFKTMLKSGDKAKDLLSQISKFGAETPFEFPELTDASKKLLAFGVSAEEIVPTLRRIGDVSSGIGAPIGEIAELYGKAKVQGRLFAEDINQLTGRGIPIIQELAKQFHTTDDNVKDLVKSGSVNFKHLQAAFVSMTSEGGQFMGLMAAQSDTLSGKFSNLKDTVTRLATELGGKLTPALKHAVDAANYVAGGGIAGVPKEVHGAAFKDVFKGADRKPAAEFLNLGNAIDAGKEALKTEKDPAKRAQIQAQIEAAEARRKQVGEDFRANTGANKAAGNQLEGLMGLGRGLFVDGGLETGAAGAAKGIKGLFGGAMRGSFAGAGLLADAKAKQAQAMTEMRNKIKEETTTPQEKFDAEMEKLRGSREMLGDDLFNRKRRMLEDELSGTFDKNSPQEKARQERNGLAPLTEARFLTSAPGFSADPATRAAQENAKTAKEQKALSAQQLVVLQAMERKLQRQTRLGVL